MFTIKDLAERLRISPNILMHISNILLQAKCLEIKGPEQQNGKANIMGLMDRYAMTEEGKRQASNFLEYDSYVGPVPVTLEDYWAQVAKQSCGQFPVNPDRIQSSFQGLIVKPELVRQLGPALASGKAIFLYGPSGNGKTTLALRLGQVWDDGILIPWCWQLKEILRRLGLRSIRELVGRTDALVHLDYYRLPVDDDLRRGA